MPPALFNGLPAVAKRANGEIIPSIKPGSRILATREPIGVVAAITPWNFPMAMLTRVWPGTRRRLYRGD